MPPAPARRFTCRVPGGRLPAHQPPGARRSITEFIRAEDPDVVGLIEVDTGSIRTGMVNQADLHRHVSSAITRPMSASTASSSVNQLVPIVRKQGNAFLAAPRVRGERFHYFDTGIKRLIIELELDECRDIPRAPVAEVPPPPVPAALPATTWCARPPSR